MAGRGNGVVRVGRAVLPARELAELIRQHAENQILDERRQSRVAGRPGFRAMPWLAAAADLRALADAADHNDQGGAVADVGQLWGDRLHPQGWMTVTGYARRARVSPRTVRRWATAGQLGGAHQTEAGIWLIPADTPPPDRKDTRHG